MWILSDAVPAFVEVSFIIPTYNRADLLSATLESILKQNKLPVEYEVIVIDNGSSDNTKEICKRYESQFKNFICQVDSMPGQLTGRHKGFKLSSGNLLCYLDDDVELNPNWLISIAELSKKYQDVSIFGGPSLPKFDVPMPEWLNQFWEITPYGGRMCLPLSLIELPSHDTIVEPVYVFGLNFSIRREAFKRLKGFHPDCIPSVLQKFQGDGETGLAIKAAMNRDLALHSPALKLHHRVTAERLTPEHFERWSFYNGVCQSFTDLRYLHHLYTGVATDQPKVKSMAGRITSLAKRVALKLKASETTDMKNRLSNEYQKGYAFHQLAFNSDILVRDWVLKPDYLDYTLPVTSYNPL